MKKRLLAKLITVVFVSFLFSCAGTPEVADYPPEWLSNQPEDTPKDFIFRGIGTGKTLFKAREKALNTIANTMIEAMLLSNPEGWSADRRQAVDDFRNDLENLVIWSSTHKKMNGAYILRQDAWFDADGIKYAMDVAWEKQAFALQSEKISATTPEYRVLEEQAQQAEKEGRITEALKTWAIAALLAKNSGRLADIHLAMHEIIRILGNWEYSLESLPRAVYIGLQPVKPIVFQIFSAGEPIKNTEFIVTYPGKNADGSPSRAERRILSDANGRVSFLPPEAETNGAQKVTIAPSINPLLTYFDEIDDQSVKNFISTFEESRLSVEYPAFAWERIVPTGILLVETDLTGNPLDSFSAAKGLVDDLMADGFDVDILTLPSEDILPLNNNTLLQEIYTDPRFPELYQRAIYGIVSLESFEQNHNAFIVRVSGTLFLTDIQRQVIIYESYITKTSSAGDSQQAMNTAFRQLGRSFAAEIINRAP